MKKIGIIGFGKIALSHQMAFNYLGNPISFSVNRSEGGRLKASGAGISRVYQDMHEAIQIEKPDGLIVTVGFEELFGVAKQLIPYGLPILLEKPSGTNLEQHNELKRLSQKHGDMVQLAVNRRFYSVFHKAIEYAGGLKAITTVDIEWSERPKLLIERGMTDESIAKIIFGNSIHGIDLLVWLAGKIENPSIITKSFGSPFRWYMAANGISETGVLYSFRSSWDYPVPWRLVIGTASKRFQFAPLETCSVQEEYKDPYCIEPDEEDNILKAGFFGQSKAFLSFLDGGVNRVPISAVDSSMKICNQFLKKLW